MVHYPLQETALGVIVGTPILASLFVVLRIYARWKLNVKLALDDWTIVAALILSIALIGPSWRHVKMWHYGMHVWQVPVRELEPNYNDWYAVMLSFQLINIPILPLVKVSIILLLLKAGSVISWLRKVLYGILFFIIIGSVVSWCLYVFICPPRTGNTWKPKTFGGAHCLGHWKMGELLIWVTCANLITDLLIFPIPFIIVQKMISASKRAKLVLVTVFLCGVVVTAIGAAKIYLVMGDRVYGPVAADWTYNISNCINHIENNVAIIVANVPVYRGLYTRWFPSANPRAATRAVQISSQWKTYDSADFGRYARKSRLVKKVYPNTFNDFHLRSITQDKYQYPKPPPPIVLSQGSLQWPTVPMSPMSSPESYTSASSLEKGDEVQLVKSAKS